MEVRQNVLFRWKKNLAATTNPFDRGRKRITKSQFLHVQHRDNNLSEH